MPRETQDPEDPDACGSEQADAQAKPPRFAAARHLLARSFGGAAIDAFYKTSFGQTVKNRVQREIERTADHRAQRHAEKIYVCHAYHDRPHVLERREQKVQRKQSNIAKQQDGGYDGVYDDDGEEDHQRSQAANIPGERAHRRRRRSNKGQRQQKAENDEEGLVYGPPPGAPRRRAAPPEANPTPTPLRRSRAWDAQGQPLKGSPASQDHELGVGPQSQRSGYRSEYRDGIDDSTQRDIYEMTGALPMSYHPPPPPPPGPLQRTPKKRSLAHGEPEKEVDHGRRRDGRNKQASRRSARPEQALHPAAAHGLYGWAHPSDKNTEAREEPNQRRRCHQSKRTDDHDVSRGIKRNDHGSGRSGGPLHDSPRLGNLVKDPHNPSSTSRGDFPPTEQSPSLEPEDSVSVLGEESGKESDVSDDVSEQFRDSGVAFTASPPNLQAPDKRRDDVCEDPLAYGEQRSPTPKRNSLRPNPSSVRQPHAAPTAAGSSYGSIPMPEKQPPPKQGLASQTSTAPQAQHQSAASASVKSSELLNSSIQPPVALTSPRSKAREAALARAQHASSASTAAVPPYGSIPMPETEQGWAFPPFAEDRRGTSRHSSWSSLTRSWSSLTSSMEANAPKRTSTLKER